MRFFKNYLDNISVTPNDSYRNDLQNLIYEQWTNSTQISGNRGIPPVFEQEDIGIETYKELEVSIDMVVEMGTGLRKSDDFKTFAFREITHNTTLGLMYKFNDSYWITINESELASVVSSAVVRRCNNTLRWVDKYNGSIVEMPCVIEYDATSPSPQYDKDINTPNNSYVIIAQGNDKTRELKVNQRFIINGRPFKLTGYNNALQNSMVDGSTTLYYYDVYLDEISPSDDLENNVANRFDYNYKLDITNKITQQVKGYSGKLDGVVYLNDEVVDRKIIWSCNENAQIDSNGDFTLIGENGSIATFEAHLEGNTNVYDELSIEITDNIEDVYNIFITPLYEEIKQYETVKMYYGVTKNGNMIHSNIDIIDIGKDNTYEISHQGLKTLEDVDELTLNQLDLLGLGELDGGIDEDDVGCIEIKCLKSTNVPLIIRLVNENITREINIKLKSFY